MLITEIQRFCMHDGPGLRTTVFTKGCPMRCEWCHNPETQNQRTELLYENKKCILCRACEVCPNGVHAFNSIHNVVYSECTVCGRCTQVCPTAALSLCGKAYTNEEIFDVVERDRAFYGATGGVTISGGEPFLQAKDALSFLKFCKNHGVNTAVETCGYFSQKILPEAVSYTDLFLWDIKLTDPCAHIKFTGVSNKIIIENLKLADEIGAKTRIRCIVVNGVNTFTSHYDAVAKIALSLKNCEGVELIPYHAYGGSKALLVGREDNGKAEWIPSDELLNDMRNYISNKGVFVF